MQEPGPLSPSGPLSPWGPFSPGWPGSSDLGASGSSRTFKLTADLEIVQSTFPMFFCSLSLVPASNSVVKELLKGQVPDLLRGESH